MWSISPSIESTHIAICVERSPQKRLGECLKYWGRCWGVLECCWDFFPLYFGHFYGERCKETSTSAYSKEPNREPESFCDSSPLKIPAIGKYLTQSETKKSTKAKFKMEDNQTKRDLWRPELSLSRTTCGGYLPVATHRRQLPTTILNVAPLQTIGNTIWTENLKQLIWQ